MRDLDDEPTFKALAFTCAKDVVSKATVIEDQREELTGMKRKLKEEEAEKNKVVKKLEKSEEKLKNVRHEKKKEHDTLVYQKQVVGKAREQLKLQQDVTELQRQLTEVLEKFRGLESENKLLRELVEEKEREIEELDEEREPEVDLMEGRRYKPELIALVWELLDENVAQGRVSSIITKCGKLFKKIPKQLPTRKTIADMDLSRLAASQKHLEVEKISFPPLVN